jgi:hypothetical protein
VLLLQDLAHDIIGFTGVNHQRQTALPGGDAVLAEHLGLHVARRQIVVEIQPALADADHARALGQLDQTRGDQARIFLGSAMAIACTASKAETLSQMVTIRATPASRARAMTASLSSAN